MAASSGIRGSVAPCTTAVVGIIPARIYFALLSTTTIALSTSIPIAIIKPANEVRLRPSPTRYITTNVAPIAKSSDEPTTTPSRQPITSITNTTTISSDSKRLTTKSLFACSAILFSGYSDTISKPAGSSLDRRSSWKSTLSPTFTISISGSVATAIATASLPSTEIIIERGVLVSRSTRATSPKRYCLPSSAISN